MVKDHWYLFDKVHFSGWFTDEEKEKCLNDYRSLCNIKIILKIIALHGHYNVYKWDTDANFYIDCLHRRYKVDNIDNLIKAYDLCPEYGYQLYCMMFENGRLTGHNVPEEILEEIGI